MSVVVFFSPFRLASALDWNVDWFYLGEREKRTCLIGWPRPQTGLDSQRKMWRKHKKRKGSFLEPYYVGTVWHRATHSTNFRCGVRVGAPSIVANRRHPALWHSQSRSHVWDDWVSCPLGNWRREDFPGGEHDSKNWRMRGVGERKTADRSRGSRRTCLETWAGVGPTGL